MESQFASGMPTGCGPSNPESGRSPWSMGADRALRFPPQPARERVSVFGLCLALIAALVSPGLADAVTTNSAVAPQTLTLAEAQAAAFQRNWDLLAAKSGIDFAEAQLLVTREFPNPTASLSTAKLGSHESATPMGNSVWSRNYDTIAAVSQLIEIAGKRRDRQNAARAGLLGARARFFDARRTLDQGVTKAYVAALLARENARILRESAGYMSQEARIAEAQFKAGDISDSNMKLLQVNAGQFEVQAKQAEAAALQARIAVEVLMAVKEPAGAWTSPETLEQLVTTLTPPPAAAKSGATRPDVLAAQADLKAAKANLELQKALRIPDPTISVQIEHNPPGGGPAVDTAGIGLSFPLPVWNLNRGNINAAKASLAQYEAALGKAMNQMAADVAVAQSEYDEASARWRRYQDQIAPQSAKVRESVKFAYEKGAATLVDFLNAQQTDNNIRLGVAQAMNDTASAVADLIAARQVLTETELNSRK